MSEWASRITNNSYWPTLNKVEGNTSYALQPGVKTGGLTGPKEAARVTSLPFQRVQSDFKGVKNDHAPTYAQADYTTTNAPAHRLDNDWHNNMWIA